MRTMSLMFVMLCVSYFSVAQSVTVDGAFGVKATTIDSVFNVNGSAKILGSLNLDDGNDNLFLGEEAGSKNKYNAGLFQGTLNTFVGSFAGLENTAGLQNSFFGSNSGEDNTSGQGNTFIGSVSGASNQTGSFNTFLGTQADFYNLNTGVSPYQKAIAIGYFAKVDCSNCAVIGGTGNNAVKVGIKTRAPEYSLDVTHSTVNPVIGNGNGFALRNDGSNSRNWVQYINNSDGNYTFYGDGVLKAEIELASGNWIPKSDAKTKRNIKDLPENTLAKIQELRPTTYQFKDQKSERQIYGLIAQEVREIFPDIVIGMGEDGSTIGVSYTELIPILIKSVQELSAEKEQLKAQNEAMLERLSAIEARLNIGETAVLTQKN